MPIDTIVKNPNNISKLCEVEDILNRMNAYEKERNCEPVVLLIQNHQVGEVYRIKCIGQAKHDIQNSKKCEPGIEFYTRSYFEKLREKYNH